MLLVTHTLSRMATSTATGFLVSKRTAEVGTYNIYNIYNFYNIYNARYPGV